MCRQESLATAFAAAIAAAVSDASADLSADVTRGDLGRDIPIRTVHVRHTRGGRAVIVVHAACGYVWTDARGLPGALGPIVLAACRSQAAALSMAEYSDVVWYDAGQVERVADHAVAGMGGA